MNQWPKQKNHSRESTINVILSKILRTVLALHPDHNPKIDSFMVEGCARMLDLYCRHSVSWKSPQFLSKKTPLQQITLPNFSTSFLPSLQLGTHRNLSSLVLFASNKNQQTSFPIDPLSLSLSLSLSHQLDYHSTRKTDRSKRSANLSTSKCNKSDDTQ